VLIVLEEKANKAWKTSIKKLVIYHTFGALGGKLLSVVFER